MRDALRVRWIATVMSVVAASVATPAAAVTMDGTYLTRFSLAGGSTGDPCPVAFTQVGDTVSFGSLAPCALGTSPVTFAFGAEAYQMVPGEFWAVQASTDLPFCSPPPAPSFAFTSTDGESFSGGFTTCLAWGEFTGVRDGGPLCGNGVVDVDEECDGTACCSPSCRIAVDGSPCQGSQACRADFVCTAGTCGPTSVDPPGTSCNTDADQCTVERCDAAGDCVSDGATLECGPCQACQASSGCRLIQPSPPGACAGPIVPSAKLSITDKSATATTSWNLGRGPAFVIGDLGDPIDATGWELCVYGIGELGPEAVLAVDAPAGSGWRAAKGGFRFQQTGGTNRTTIQIKPGAAGKSKVTVKRKGPLTFAGILNLTTPPFIVELRSDTGSCFASAFDTPRVHTPTTLRATDGHAR